jgi:hypothetical protein
VLTQRQTVLAWTSRDVAWRANRVVAAAIFGLAVVFCTLLYLVQLQVFGENFWTQPSGLMLRDFAFFWGAARLFWFGHIGAVFDPGVFNGWLAGQLAPGTLEPYATWSYPPAMLLPLLPFGLLPAPLALAVWLLATFALLAAVLMLTFRNERLTLAVLLSPAAFYCLSFGQNGALTAALLIGGLWLLDRRPAAAGVMLGLLVIKPQLGILLPFALAAGGYWRAFAAAALAASAVLVLSWLLFGAAAWLGFLHETAPHMTAQLLHDWGIPPQHAMPTTLVTLQGWGLSTHAAIIGQVASMIVAIAAVVWAWRRSGAPRQWRNALTCAAVLLATPFGYVYDMIPAMLAAALLARAGFASGFARAEPVVVAAVWIWPAVTVVWIHVLGLPPVGAACLAAMVLCLAGRIAWRAEGAVAPAIPSVVRS